MHKTFTFLRALNVGGRNVKMDALRAHFEDMGFTGVESFIASGNIIFDSNAAGRQALEKQIEEGLLKALGYPVDTFVRTAEEVARIAEAKPFPGMDQIADSYQLYVAFTHQAPASQARENLMAHTSDIDSFAIDGSEIYWLCTETQSKSDFSGARLEKAIGAPATMRNIRTIQRLYKKYQ